MKTLIICLCFLMPVSQTWAKPTKNTSKKLQLDLKQSQVSFHQLVFKFESGFFLLKGGEVKSGELVLDVRGVPLIDTQKYPKVKFRLNRWTVQHNFAPGSPNLIIGGVVTAGGKSYSVETTLFYQPSAQGFEANGKIQFGKKDTLLQGEIELKIVARS
jgi:hypothetical protein